MQIHRRPKEQVLSNFSSAACHW